MNPAFDTPTTVDEVIAMLEIWGDPRNKVFNPERAKRASEILSKAFRAQLTVSSVDLVCGRVLLSDGRELKNLTSVGGSMNATDKPTFEIKGLIKS